MADLGINNPVIQAMQQQIEHLTRLLEAQAQQPQQVERAPFREEENHVRFPKPKPYDGKAITGAVENFLFDCEQYFGATNIQDADRRILFAASQLEGVAKTWWRYQVEQVQRGFVAPVVTWQDFRGVLTSRFQIINAVRVARDRLAELRQISSVRSYVTQFQNVLMQISEVHEGEALDRFIRGLKPRTKMEVTMREPTGLEEAMRMAERYDSLVSTTFSRPRPHQVMQTLHTRPDEAVPMEVDAIQRRTLTNADRERLRQNGGCFYCRQLGHRIAECPNRNGRGRPIAQAEYVEGPIDQENDGSQ